MNNGVFSDRKDLMLGGGLFLLIALGWLAAFFYAPVDRHQGEIYRIIFLHVPSAFSAFLAAFVLFICSVWSLRAADDRGFLWSKACAEVGLLFTILTLATGSIWGRPTWGTWWTWDARLTTTFLLALLYAGFLLMCSAMEAGPARRRATAVLGILIFIDVPIIYKSVTWWRTLHQPQSMWRDGGSTMDPSILNTLLMNILVMCCLSLWLMRERARNHRLREELESASFDQQS